MFSEIWEEKKKKRKKEKENLLPSPVVSSNPLCLF
jgi:hypothetical protein